MAKQGRIQQAREKKVQCEVITGDRHRRCTSNGDHTYGRVLCWTHRKAHEAGRVLSFVDPAGAFLRTLLDPGAVDVTRRIDRRFAR